MARKGGRDRGLFERPKGSGIWWIHYHDGDGRKHREKVGPKGLARARYMQRKTEIREGRYFPDTRGRAVLFDELLEAYRTEKEREGKAVMDSDIGFRRLLERFGGRRADSIATREVKEWRDELLEGHTPATVNRHLTILRAVLRMAVRDKRIDSGALPEIEPFEENNERTRWLNDEEEARLMAAAPEYLRPALLVDIHTGLRRGELLNLRWDDIDFLGQSIRVRESKSGKGRNVPMDSVVIKTLVALRSARRERLRSRVVRQSEASGYVFSAPRGGFMGNLNRHWYPTLKRASLEGLHFHDLRHTFGSRLALANVPIFTIQKLMGHRTLAMTMRYAHLSKDHLREAVERLGGPEPKPWATASERPASES
jgi:integrase